MRVLDLNAVKSFVQQRNVFDRQAIPVVSLTDENSIDLDNTLVEAESFRKLAPVFFFQSKMFLNFCT
jgi:hypothetical protein